MKNVSFIGIILFLFIFSSCDNSLEEDKKYAEEKKIESYISAKKWSYEKANGVYHAIVKSSYNYQVNAGDTVKFWFKGYTIVSPIDTFDTNIESTAIATGLSTSTHNFQPIKIVAGKGTLIDGLDQGILLCRLNQVSTILFTSNLGFKGEQMENVPVWSPLAFYIEITYLNGPGIEAEKQVLNAIDYTGYSKHESGLYYKFLVDTSALRPTTADTVYGWYNISQIDGTSVMESNIPNEQIALSDKNVIDAIKIGFTLMSVGGSAEFIASSPIAFGNNGNKYISAYQPIRLTMRLDSVK